MLRLTFLALFQGVLLLLELALGLALGSYGTVLLKPLLGSLDEKEVDLGELREPQIFKLQFLVVEEVSLDELEDRVPLLLGGKGPGDFLPELEGGGEKS